MINMGEKKVGKKGGSKAHGPAGRGFGGRRDRLTRLEALGRSRKRSKASRTAAASS
jgi:hypothetical protein